MARHTILTEECPQVAELSYICTWLGYTESVRTPFPIVVDNKWTGAFEFTDAPIELRLFAGSGSVVDYVVRDNETNKYILLLESTKGDEDGNPYYQRITKLVVASNDHPEASLVMFYTEQPKTTSKSFTMSLRMFKTIGVEAVVGPSNANFLDTVEPYATFESFQYDTNIITPASGVPVRIQNPEPDMYTISARLSKSSNSKISSDPQVGRVTAMCATVVKINPKAKFIVKDHGVTELTQGHKFWYANGAWDVRLEGLEQTALGNKRVRDSYTEDARTEKVATILFQLIDERPGFSCVFSNHAGCERTHLTRPDGSKTKTEKKTTLPDVVMANHERKEVYIFEGKTAKNVKQGDKQLDAMDDFWKFMKEKGAYEGYRYSKGLIVYGETKVETKHKIWFTVTNDWTIKR
jgi:hypothetical protein